MTKIINLQFRASNIITYLNNLSYEGKQSLNDWVENDGNGDLEPDLNHFEEMIRYWQDGYSYSDFVEKYMK